MTTDSANKRASIGNMPWSSELPIPDSGISSSDRMMVGGEYLIHPWKSPDSVLLDTDWDDSANVHDNNTATYAVGSEATLFTELQLAFSPAIKTDLWRVWAEGFTNPDTHNPDILVQGWYDDNWHNLWNGSITKSTWFEYPTQGVVWMSKISIISNDSVYDYLRVYEIQVLNLDILVEDSVIPKVGGGLVRNSLLGSGLVT